jgi:glucose/arabinose dehydrogenase
VTPAAANLSHSVRIAAFAAGLDEPQGVAYLPDLNRIVVTSSADGSCKIFDGTTYERLAAAKFADDADQLRHDASRHLIYVGYGDGHWNH